MTEVAVPWILQEVIGGAVLELGLAAGTRWKESRAAKQAITETVKAFPELHLRDPLETWADNHVVPTAEALKNEKLGEEYVSNFLTTLRLLGVPADESTAGRILERFFRALLEQRVGPALAIIDARSAARFEAVSQLIQEQPRRSAKRRSRRVIGTPVADVSFYVGRDRERAELREVLLERPEIHLLQITGKPGYGKSALGARTLKDLTRHAAVEAVIFAGSRDQRGLSLRRIAADVSTLLAGTPAVEQIRAAWDGGAPAEARANVLAGALRDVRCLLFLDDLDPLLGSDGSLGDAELAAFVRAVGNGLSRTTIVTTSQLPVAAEGSFVLALREALSVDDAVSLLRRRVPRAIAKDALFLQRLAYAAECVPRSLELIAQDPKRIEEARQARDVRELRTFVTRELLESAYQRLSRSERTAADVLALFERPASEAALRQVLAELDEDVTALSSDVGRLVERQIVRKTPNGHELALHPLDKRFLVAELDRDPARQRAGHLAIAGYYRSIRAQTYRSREDVDPNLRELDHLVCAEAYSAALDVIDEIDYDHLAIWGESELLLRERKKLPDEALSEKERARNWLGIGAAHAELGQPAKALTWYERALVAASGDEQLLMRLRLLIGMARVHIGAYARAKETLAEVIQHAEALGNERDLGRALSGYGLAQVGLGEYRQAIVSYKKALAIARKHDPRGVVRRLANLGLVHLHLGDPDRALGYLTQALKHARRVGDARGEGRIFIHLARTNEYVGRFDDALRFLDLARERTKIVGDTTGLANSDVVRAALLRQLGRLPEALNAVEQGLEKARETRLQRLEAEALSVRAQILLDQGRPDAAKEALHDALAIAGTEMPRERCAALVGLARMAGVRGDWQKAFDLAGEAIAAAGAMTSAAAAARVMQMRAALNLGEALPEKSEAEEVGPLAIRAEMALLRELAAKRVGHTDALQGPPGPSPPPQSAPPSVQSAGMPAPKVSS